MNRREAIQHVLQIDSDLSEQFAISTRLRKERAEDTRAALRALGVSEAEIVEART